MKKLVIEMRYLSFVDRCKTIIATILGHKIHLQSMGKRSNKFRVLDKVGELYGVEFYK